MNKSELVPWVIFILAGAIPLAGWIYLLTKILARFRVWRRVAEALGLDLMRAWFSIQNSSPELDHRFEKIPGSRFGTTVLHGIVDGFDVSIISDGFRDSYELDVNGDGKISSSLSLPLPSNPEDLPKLGLSNPDKHWDLVSSLIGGDEALAAVLDRDTRTSVMDEVTRLGAEVRFGHIRLSHYGIKNAPIMVRRVVELARKLSPPPEEIPDRLARNALHDPNPAVRRINLTLLQENHPDHPQAVSVSRALLKSSHPVLRLGAARFLGEEGLPAALELVRTSSLDPPHRRSALQIVLRWAPEDERVMLVNELSADPLPDMIHLLIDAADTLGLPDVQNVLLCHADRMDEKAAVRMAETVRNLISVEAENALLGFLDRGSIWVQETTVRTLGRVGSAASVEPLLELSKDVWSPIRLKAAARQAVTQIQSRLEGAEAGQLSLAQPAEGTGDLSLADEGSRPAGALSLPREAEPSRCSVDDLNPGRQTS